MLSDADICRVGWTSNCIDDRAKLSVAEITALEHRVGDETSVERRLHDEDTAGGRDHASSNRRSFFARGR
jgi:hypothetical protein